MTIIFTKIIKSTFPKSTEKIVYEPFQLSQNKKLKYYRKRPSATKPVNLTQTVFFGFFCGSWWRTVHVIIIIFTIITIFPINNLLLYLIISVSYNSCKVPLTNYYNCVLSSSVKCHIQLGEPVEFRVSLHSRAPWCTVFQIPMFLIRTFFFRKSTSK